MYVHTESSGTIVPLAIYLGERIMETAIRSITSSFTKDEIVTGL